MRRFAVFALFILVLSPAFARHNFFHPVAHLLSRSCMLAMGKVAQSLQGHWVKPVPVKIGFPYSDNPDYSMTPVESVLPDFDPSSEIIFGFTNRCHAYIAGARYRFDGLGYGAGWTRRNGVLVSPGAFVRLSGLRSYQMKSLNTMLEYHVTIAEGISCIDQALSPLQATGIKFGRNPPPVFPVEIFVESFTGTFSHHDGMPLRSRAYITEGVTLDHLLHWVIRQQEERENQIAAKIIEAGGEIPPFLLSALEKLNPEARHRLVELYLERYANSTAPVPSHDFPKSPH